MYLQNITILFSGYGQNCTLTTYDPLRKRNKLRQKDVMKSAPKVTESEVIKGFAKRKQKKSHVPNDIPAKIKKEFREEFSIPVAAIFNQINSCGEYPRQWVREYITPIPKVPHPECEDDLRPISLTEDLSRDYNKLLAGWIWPYIADRLDPGQFGGVKGGSITHYLVLLYNFILSKTDDKFPTAL